MACNDSLSTLTRRRENEHIFLHFYFLGLGCYKQNDRAEGANFLRVLEDAAELLPRMMTHAQPPCVCREREAQRIK